VRSTAAEVIWNIPSALRLTSETGYINAQMDRSQDLFGTPLDVTLAELAIESMFPADPQTAELLAGAARGKTSK